MNPSIIPRFSIILLTCLALVSCQSAPALATKTPRKEVIYRSSKIAAHADPPGGNAVVWKKDTEPQGAASRCIRPVAQGLCIAGRVALFPMFVAAAIYGGPQATVNGMEKLLDEPLP